MKIKLGKQGGKYTSATMSEMTTSTFTMLMAYARKGMDVEASETEQLGLAITPILKEKIAAIDEINEWKSKLIAGDESVTATQEFEL